MHDLLRTVITSCFNILNTLEILNTQSVFTRKSKQKFFCFYRTLLKVILQIEFNEYLKIKLPLAVVKSSISIGDVTFSIVGKDEKKDYFIFGTPVAEVNNAIKLCKDSHPVITKDAWNHCVKIDYVIESVGDKHVKVNSG